MIKKFENFVNENRNVLLSSVDMDMVARFILKCTWDSFKKEELFEDDVKSPNEYSLYLINFLDSLMDSNELYRKIYDILGVGANVDDNDVDFHETDLSGIDIDNIIK